MKKYAERSEAKKKNIKIKRGPKKLNFGASKPGVRGGPGPQGPPLDRLVTEWWDACIEPHSEKVKIIADCVEKIGKANFVSVVMEKLQPERLDGQHANSTQTNGYNDERELNDNNDNGSLSSEQSPEPSNMQHANSTQTNGNDNNDERELNCNDGSEIQQRPEPSNGQHGNLIQTDSNDNIDERDLNGDNWSEILEQWSAERDKEGDQTVIKQVDGSFQNGHNCKESSAHAPFVPTIKRKFNEENTFKTKSKYGRLSDCSEGETMQM